VISLRLDRVVIRFFGFGELGHVEGELVHPTGDLKGGGLIEGMSWESFI
jgi:hypothetical protein